MKKLALLALVFLLAVPAFGQKSKQINVVSSLPAFCSPTDFDLQRTVVYLNSGLNTGIYWCTAANIWTQVGPGTVTITGTPAAGNLTKWSGSTSITNGDLSGDCTTSGTLAITCTKTNGVAFAASATTDATNAGNISSGTLSAARLPALGLMFEMSLGGVTTLVGDLNVFLASFKSARALTVQNIAGSVAALTCTTNPTIAFLECGTSATCAAPTTIGTVTVSSANTVTMGTVSSSSIASGDFVVAELTAGVCTSITGLSATLTA